MQKSFVPYFRDIFKELCERSDSADREETISKLTFVEYCKLPGILQDRFFYVLAKSSEHHDKINYDDFFEGMF